MKNNYRAERQREQQEAWRNTPRTLFQGLDSAETVLSGVGVAEMAENGSTGLCEDIEHANG